MQLVESLKSHQNVGRAERLISLGVGTALLLAGRRRRPLVKALLALAGGTIASRGLAGFCPAYQALGLDSGDVKSFLDRRLFKPQAVRVHKTITIRRPVDEVFQFCNNPVNLQLAIKSLERIERLADGYQRWYFRAPRGFRFSCDLEITQDQENNNLISWRSRPNASLTVQGFVSFRPGRDTKETEVRASISYEPPLGLLGHLAARGVSPLTDQLVVEALRHVRQILEAKEIPTTAGQPSGRRLEHAPKGADDWRQSESKANVDEFENRYRQSTDADGRVLH